MKMCHLGLRAGLAFLLGGLAWIACVSPSVAANAVSQVPCAVGPNDECVSFGPSDAIPIIRQISFNAPGAGTAVVTFHGSLVCDGSNAFNAMMQPVGSRVAFVSQIVDRAIRVPDITKPGSLLHDAKLIPGVTAFSWTATFNLASNRVFTIGEAGLQRYYFKIERVQHYANMTCKVYNAVFTVQFTP